MNTLILSLIGIAVSALFVGLSVPLIKRSIPMNGFYGARFPQSYKSKENWYDINEYAGKALAVWSIPVFCISIYGLIAKADYDSFQWIWCAVLFASIFISTIQSFIKAVQIDKRNAQQDAAANP